MEEKIQEALGNLETIKDDIQGGDITNNQILELLDNINCTLYKLINKD